jgi:hypothetical protein
MVMRGWKRQHAEWPVFHMDKLQQRCNSQWLENEDIKGKYFVLKRRFNACDAVREMLSSPTGQIVLFPRILCSGIRNSRISWLYHTRQYIWV